MERILRFAGLPSRANQMISGVVDICRECKAWASPKPDITPAVKLIIAQNENIETDTMFFKGGACMNIVEVCDRFHDSGPMDNRDMETLVEAIQVIWILIVDSETSLNTKAAEERLKAFGITSNLVLPSNMPGL